MALIVRMDNESVPTVKFFKDEKLRKLLCEVTILKTREASSAVQIALFSKCSSASNIKLNFKSNPRCHWFYFTSLCDWSRKLAPLSQLIRCGTERNHLPVLLGRLVVFNLTSHCLSRVFSFILIGCYFGFGFRKINFITLHSYS